jgi:suppressor for copper-sensitivity B
MADLRRILGYAAAVIAFVGILGASGAAIAAASPWWETDQGAVRLIAATDAVDQDEKIRLGLEFRLKPGWKVYWRSPGDAGFPPQLDWAKSENLAEMTMDWPVPLRFTVLGMQTLGYKNAVVFPLTAALFEPGRPLRLRADLRYLVCSDICVPYQTTLALDLPAGPGISAREAGLIETYAVRVPRRDGTDAGLAIARAEIGGAAPAQFIQVRITSERPIGKPELYVEGPGRYSFGAPGFALDDDRRGGWLRIAVGAPKRAEKGLVGAPVTLTLVDGDRAIERVVTLRQAPAIAAVAETPPQRAAGLVRPLWVILGLALLGGLVLNLMPCVLPVLSIKLLSVVGHGGGNPRDVRIGFLATSAGIVSAFIVLGGVAVGLKAAGLAAGWGIQFQQPIFLAVMIFILTLFAANLFGLYEIRLPGRVQDAAARAGGGHSLGGDFLTGSFATVLATPCSAPFLGTAVGFALARGPFEILSVFVALGLGLSVPYLTVAAFPRVATRLPRPGPWMVTLRRILGVALLATALWLVSVFAAQLGWPMAVMIAALMAAVLMALWPVRLLPASARLASWGVVAALGVLSLFAAANDGGGRAGGTATARVTAPHWQVFDQAAIPRAVAAGRVVLVDVTADWCITCQVNKALVLDRGEVLRRLTDGSVLAMQADWTSPDPVITRYLAGFGRYGIPFNVVYGPARPDGVILPEILTAEAVLGALARAAGGATTSDGGAAPPAVRNISAQGEKS